MLARFVTGLAVVTLSVWAASIVVPTAPRAQETPRPAGWDDATHGRGVAPDYARLFSTDTVHEIRITIAPQVFSEMQEDLREVVPAVPGGLRGRGGPGGRGGANVMAAMMEAGIDACTDKAESAACTASGLDGQCNAMFGGPLMCMPEGFGNFGRGGNLSLTTRDPMRFPVSVRHEGRVWTNVAMRYKGNSSLMASTMSNNQKIAFRLDFDRFEDDIPEIRNQRFYGFDELTFSSNFGDDSQIREALTAEIFRDRDVPAPRVAFYRVVVDAGAGPSTGASTR